MSRRVFWRILRQGCCAGFVLLSGCVASTVRVYHFPAEWPKSVATEPIGVPAVEQAEPVSSAFSVAVDPMEVLSGEGDQPSKSSRQDTGVVLARLLVAKLRAQGVNAVFVTEDKQLTTDYYLYCQVKQMKSVVEEDYPSIATYIMALECELYRVDTEKVVWRKRIDEPVDDTAVVNTMSRLPADYHERLVRYSVMPTLDLLANGLARYFSREGSSASSPAAPAVPATPAGKGAI